MHYSEMDKFLRKNVEEKINAHNFYIFSCHGNLFCFVEEFLLLLKFKSNQEELYRMY